MVLILTVHYHFEWWAHVIFSNFYGICMLDPRYLNFGICVVVSYPIFIPKLESCVCSVIKENTEKVRVECDATLNRFSNSRWKGALDARQWWPIGLSNIPLVHLLLELVSLLQIYIPYTRFYFYLKDILLRPTLVWITLTCLFNYDYFICQKHAA